MTTYIFERDGGTLSTDNVKQIIKAAGYDPASLSYTNEGPHQVKAAGAEVMAPSRLEHAAKQLGYKGTSVTVVD